MLCACACACQDCREGVEEGCETLMVTVVLSLFGFGD